VTSVQISAKPAVTIGRVFSDTFAGNNFELAIATYGAASRPALAGVVGPLIEVPVLVGLVYVSMALRPRLFGSQPVSDSRSTR
jgi:arsenate reductase (thioredoxin)